MKSKISEVDSITEAHDKQKESLAKVVSELENKGLNPELVYRDDLKKVNSPDLVVAVGGDGTFLKTSHYLNQTPIMGVNADPRKSTGFFCCYNNDTFSKAMNNLEAEKETTVSRLELTLNGDVLPEQTLNDVLITHKNPAATMRYRIKDGVYKNSGLLVCTAAGSTARMYQEGGNVMNLNLKRIQYHEIGVRNAPFSFTQSLRVESRLNEGTILIDGEDLSYDFPIGSTLEINDGKPLRIIGNLHIKRLLYNEEEIPHYRADHSFEL